MGALVLLVVSGYFFVTGRGKSGPIYDTADEWMGEEAASFLLTALGGALFCIALLWMLSKAMT